MNADVFEAVCAMGDAARTAQSQLAQANTEAKNQLLNAIADALDRSRTLPLALCGGLGEVLLAYLPQATRARCLAPQGDSARGALLMIERHLERTAK